MRISFSRYSLFPRNRLNAKTGSGPREGALLRVDFPGIGIGYADVHPWTELGDASLEEQLLRLTHGTFTPLTERSIFFALKDAEARAGGRSLFHGLSIPESHWLITDLLGSDLRVPPDFGKVKVKVGRDVDAETTLLSELLDEFAGKVRLDFNAADERLVERFLEKASPWVERIDFIEDPTPWNPEVWKRLSRRVRLAADREPGEGAVTVIKPAVQNDVPPRGQLVFTSYLDHPVGQACAAWIAAKTRRESPARVEECGLLSHFAYEPNEFSEALQNDGPTLRAPYGTGIGFDELLRRQKWEPLA